MRNNWSEFRSEEYAVIDTMRTIAVLPVAAIEQHGPHLPVGTDMIIGEGMLAEVRKRLPDSLDVRILPMQSVGKSNEHLWAAGTLTLTAETAMRCWKEIGLSVSRTGIRKIIFANSHGGNVDLISIVARELRVDAGMYAVKCQWGSFGRPAGLFSDLEQQFGIHGGDYETSMMLHFRPDLVRMDKAENFQSTAENDPISPIGPLSYGWVAKDLNPAGVVGEAAAATAAKGAAAADHQARGLSNCLRRSPLWIRITLLWRTARTESSDSFRTRSIYQRQSAQQVLRPLPSTS